MSLHDQHRRPDPADSDPEQDRQVEAEEEADAGDRIPRWAYMTLVASRVVWAPIFLVPYAIIAAMIIVNIDNPLLLVLGLFGAASCTLAVATCDSVNRMLNAGVLEVYVSSLLGTTWVGRFFRRRYLAD